MSIDDDLPEMPLAAEPETVGYTKPPKATRFKPGQSGNKRGRPRGAKGRRALVEKVLGERQTIVEGGAETSKTMLELVLLKLRHLAFAGNVRAFKALEMLQAKFTAQPPQRIGGALIVPEPMTLEEWEERFAAKPPSPVQTEPDEKK